MADDLAKALPELVDPGSWKIPSQDGFGVIRKVATRPSVEQLPGQVVSATAGDQQPAPEDAEEAPGNVLVVPQAVLIIRHTARVHREIEQLIKQIERGEPAFGDGSGARFGGGGGGFFQLPPERALSVER